MYKNKLIRLAYLFPSVSKKRQLSLIFIIIPLLFFSLSSFAYLLKGEVVGVGDGDTVTVLSPDKQQVKIRLLGIDAPEKKQPFGQISKRNLSDLIFKKEVQVEWRKKDKYGRMLGKIILNSVDINLEQIKSGLAWHYKHYEKEQNTIDRKLYEQVQQAAKEKKIGLWSHPHPIPPWEWRKMPKSRK